jgi:Ni/Co efflux regulator RcnB
MRRGLISWCLALMLVALVEAHADERRRGHEPRDFPFSSEHWDGWREWTPDRQQRRHWHLPDHFTIDKPGKCEVRCERVGREYRCREYRC